MTISSCHYELIVSHTLLSGEIQLMHNFHDELAVFDIEIDGVAIFD